MIIDKEEIKNTVFKWLVLAKKDLIENYDRLGLRASGKYEKDLSIVENENGYGLESAKHWGAMEYGRAKTIEKGDVSLLSIITEWVKVKGITPTHGTLEQMIKNITWKIHHHGIRVPNIHNKGKVVWGVLTDERINRLVERLKKEIVNGLNK